ncbi:MAG: Uma2 family endonuclease [Acidobacteria bacterium]|nr:Uma2 family endonuclease [Acidobacteriota bacterium]
MPVSSAAARADDVVILHEASWQTYKALSADSPPGSGVRLTYDQGRLQIMTLSAGHERPNRDLSDLVLEMTRLLDIDYCPVGSTTLEREDLKRASEPDSAFYFRSPERVAARSEISLPSDPPPDLVIEVDVSRRSLDKLPLYAAMGVSEVWRYRDGRVRMYVLGPDGRYEDAAQSRWLAPLTPEAATHFIAARTKLLRHSAWAALIAAWFRSARQNP